MISTENISLQFGGRTLFEDVTIKFNPGNCYGLIGANGAGKSTFLKILSGQVEPTRGNVFVQPGERMAVLKQNQFEFDEFPVLETVIMGHQRLYAIMKEKDAIYAKPDFNDDDGMKAAELEGEFADLNGWDAESEAAGLLNALGIDKTLHEKTMKELEGSEKVRVLLAQALFGRPNILLLDEPTNHLNLTSIEWLENFLASYEGTVIVVSHDRHFLNQVCTHIADIDFSKIQMYVGNYDFWYESSQLALQLQRESNKRVEEKRKELEEFIRRFSANASKSKQATSRKKSLERLTLEDIKPSTRKYPFINFKAERDAGKQLFSTEDLTVTMDNEEVLSKLNLTIHRNDKVAFIGGTGASYTALFETITGSLEKTSGTFTWGGTVKYAYFPKDNITYFQSSLNLIDWLRQYSVEQDEAFIRGFLGRMLFSGEETLKAVNVISGGERVRLMLSRMMLLAPNVLIFDEPTNHLDLESITALNNALIQYDGTILFTSHDLQFVQTIANRVVEITPLGNMDKIGTYDEYLVHPDVKKFREKFAVKK